MCGMSALFGATGYCAVCGSSKDLEGSNERTHVGMLGRGEVCFLFIFFFFLSSSLAR